MIVTNVGMGCGGRGSVLRATGFAGRASRLVSDYQASGRETMLRTAKSCGPDAPTLASSSRRPLWAEDFSTARAHGAARA